MEAGRKRSEEEKRKIEERWLFRCLLLRCSYSDTRVPPAAPAVRVLNTRINTHTHTHTHTRTHALFEMEL